MDKRRKEELLVLIVLTGIILFFIIDYNKEIVDFLTNLENSKAFIEKFGIFGHLVFLIIQILAVLVSPIPSQSIGLFSGYLFGIKTGIIISIIGLIIGSLIAYLIAKKFGKPLVEKLIGKRVHNRFGHIKEEKEFQVLLLLYLLPFMPDDALSFLAGLSRISLKHLVLAVLLGRTPGIVLFNLIGSEIAVVDVKAAMFIVAVVGGIALLFFSFRRSIEREMHKIFHKLRNVTVSKTRSPNRA